MLQLDGTEAGIFSANIAAGAFVDGTLVSCLGFTHFLLELEATTPIATTLDVRIVPRVAGTLDVLLPGIMVLEEFPVAVLTTAIGTNRYSAYWGEARGLVAGALGTGSTFCFTPVFFVRIRNTGAQPATGVTVRALVCM